MQLLTAPVLSDYKTPDGSGVRDYIHVVDLAEGHTLSLNQVFGGSFKGAKAYNLGLGKGKASPQDTRFKSSCLERGKNERRWKK